MSLNDLQTLFDSNNKIKFKLYSLEYIIEKFDNYVQVYAIDYPTRKNVYKTFEELMNNYTVYNEPLITTINNIRIIE